jgi:hypothetical protein
MILILITKKLTVKSILTLLEILESRDFESKWVRWIRSIVLGGSL